MATRTEPQDSSPSPQPAASEDAKYTWAQLDIDLPEPSEADRAAIALREALRRYTGMEGVQGVEVEGESLLVLTNSRKRANTLRAFVGDLYRGIPVKFSARRAPKAP